MSRPAEAAARRRPPAWLHTSRLRLVSGLVLFAFVLTHLLNHALGLVSLEAMEQGRRVFNLVWGGPGEWLVALAFVVHLVLGLAHLWQRTSWRMPLREAAQLAMGLLIPVLGTIHVLGAGVAPQLLDFRASYAFVLLGLWPGLAWWQTALTLIVWVHGCMGLHYWLRLRPLYRRFQALLLFVAIVVPLLALIGFVTGGRAIRTMTARDPGLVPALAARDNWPGPEAVAWVYGLERQLVLGFVALVVGIVLLDIVRGLLTRRRNRIRVAYDGGRKVGIPRGMSLLDGSRVHAIPHASVCGGRGRCSTCRVRIVEGADGQPPPSPAERRVLERIGAAPDVRLACQLRPVHDLRVALLMAAEAGPGDAMRRMDPNQGSEREIAVMFADLRGFTRISESRLPYDVVFLLNRYFTLMGEAIEGEGGRVDKFIGDGIMALFGIDRGPEAGARESLAAAGAMSRALARLNDELAHELTEPLRMGIGLHAGPAIVGELGYGRAVTLTAIGDTVNTASRLETLTKDYRAELVVSDHLVELAAATIPQAARHTVDLRGRTGTLGVHVVVDASTIAPPEPGSNGNGWTRLRRRLGLTPA